MEKNAEQPKVIVFHPMKQHSYKTAEALMQGGMLFSYCTSIYYDTNKILYKILNLILKENEKKKMMSHSNQKLGKYVKTFSIFYGFLYLLMERIDKTQNAKIMYKMQDLLVKKMGKKVAKYAIKNNVDIIVGYDTWSYGLIKELKRKKSKIKVIIDYSSLYPEEILKIIEQDINKNPNIKSAYNKSLEKFKLKYMQNFKYEKDNSDYYFSASNVVDDSLTKYGVENNKIYRCTFGNYFEQSKHIKPTNTNMIVFTYIGRISYAKGVHYLLDAINIIKRTDFKLQLVGKNTDNIELNNTSKQIEYLGVVLHDEIPEILKKTDIFITGSLYDGFSLSILEGFSYNIPVICTDKTGIKDYIQDGINGFVVKSCDSNALYEKINYILENKQIIDNMKKNTSNLIEHLTWENYNLEVISSIKSIVEEKI